MIDSNLLLPIARKISRNKIGIITDLPFHGLDIWNHYEISWLNDKGKPLVAMAEIIYPCDSPNLIESKSMKLYFNSFNNTKITDVFKLQKIIQEDLTTRVGMNVSVTIKHLADAMIYAALEGECLDNLDITCSVYARDKSFLTTDDSIVEEVLYSNLLKSNCPVTGQPDWGSVQIAYKGRKINHEGLLRYIISYRDCTDFGEQCVEQIFTDILTMCQPEELIVYGRYTRRGGIDINSVRATKNIKYQIENKRLCRQ